METSIEGLLREADTCLAQRECGAALIAYDSAEHAGAGEDRCAGGRWMANMLLGQYEQAWHESDAIRERGAADAHRFWMGEPIGGKRLMLRCLHGYGDTVMYLRWLPELRRRCSEVTVQVCPEMLPLIKAMVTGSESAGRHVSETALPRGFGAERRSCPVRLVTWGAPGESDRELWDVQIECAELPYLFRATTATLPEPVSLSFPELELHRIRMHLGERTKPRVGLVWTGSNYDPSRSVPFSEFRQLFEDRTAEFRSLLAPENNEEWAEFCAKRGWSERTFYTRDGAAALQYAGIADMAAFASEMDLVITIDTMAAHVAGSLGLPTWLLLKREADWRWMLDRGDSPWYPTMRLFRQKSASDWAEPLARVREALRDFCEELQA